MKVLITGSSGSIARMLINYLIEKDIEIAGLDIRESPDTLPGNKFRFYRCSITERERLKTIFSEFQPTNVIHFACSFNKVRDKLLEYDIDITGSENILESCTVTPSVKQLIFSSSAAAYGGKKDNPLWMKESEPLDPRNYRYGMNKKIIEEKFSNMEVRSDLKIVSLRFCLVLGPEFDKPKSAVSILIRLPVLPKFTKDTKLQFLHRDDLVALMDLIMKDRDISGIYNLVPDSYAIVKDIVPDKKFIPVPLFMIRSILWICWHLKIMNIQPASVVNSFYPTIVDPSRIISRYDYKFKYTSKEAFEDTIARNKIPADVWF